MQFKERELSKDPLSPEEMRRLSHGNVASLIDRKKPSFRALGVGVKPLTEDEAIALMRKEPSIIRRPIFEIDGEVIFGYNEADIAKRLGK